jgi:uncharacterized protein (TIGR02246 family)
MNASAILGAAAVAVITAACAPQPATPRPDENAIRSALNTELAKLAPTFAAKDAAAVANMFTQDAIWILPDATSYTGHAAIEARAKNLFATFPPMSIQGVVIDRLIVISDSEAVTFSHQNYTMTEKGKQPASRVNPFADYWKKGTDGAWRVAYEVNADGPAPAAPKQP